MRIVAPADWRPQGVPDLEARAWKALREVDTSVCVTAGAGAGKTELLAQKAAYLLQTGLCPAPAKVLAISFKKDAAYNLARRVAIRCTEGQARRFASMTFDAFTKSVVDRFGKALPERYRPTPDYTIAPSGRDLYEDFLRRHRSPLNASQLDLLVTRTALPTDGHGMAADVAGTLSSYWDDQLRGIRSRLTFPMLNRLALCLFETNPDLVQALRATYPYVFVDEFQDTTSAQYEILGTAFDPGHTRLTTVGDDKQRIMGFVVGSMQDGFERFTRDFAARRVSLTSNWRSHEALVAVHHVVAQRLQPGSDSVIARGKRTVDGATSAIWLSERKRDEANGIASWVAGEVGRGNIAAHEVAILVRLRADLVEDDIAPAFERHGLRVRNVARRFGTVELQDLASEDLMRTLLPFIRLGSGARDGAAWAEVVTRMRALAAVVGEDDEHRLSRRIEAIVGEARRLMAGTAPSAGTAKTLVNTLIEFIGVTSIRRGTTTYGRDADFERVRDGCTEMVESYADRCASWHVLPDDIEGRDQVPLMTIHKSKGLEFHTVVFLGFDTRSWRNLRPDMSEELRSFFVALTRAEQRAFFSFCEERGGRISWLEKLLGPGLPQVRLSAT